MMKTVKRQIVTQWQICATCWMLVVIMGVVGTVIMHCILAFDSEAKKIVTMGGIMATIGLVIWVLIATIQFQFDFNMAVSMGTTRMRFIMSYFIVIFIGNLISVALAAIISKLEEIWFLSQFPKYVGAENIYVFPYIIKYGVPAALLLTLLGGFLGALMLKFGKKAGWVLWCLWMFLCLGMPRVFDAAKDSPKSIAGMFGNAILNFFRSITESGLIIGGIVLAAVCLYGTYGILKKQQVTI